MNERVFYVHRALHREAPLADPLLSCFCRKDIRSIALSESDDIASTCRRIESFCNARGQATGVIVIVNLDLGGQVMPPAVLRSRSTVREAFTAVADMTPQDSTDPAGASRPPGLAELRSLAFYRHLSETLEGKAVFVFTTDRIGLNQQARSLLFSRLRWEGVSMLYSWGASHDYYSRNARYLSRLAGQLRRRDGTR